MSDTMTSSDEQQHSVKTILVVEDDDDVGAFLVYALKTETPHQALHAPDGVQALEIVKTIVPDLFILDYQLPQMNGLELYDHFQGAEACKKIPTVLMSANLPMREIEKRRVSALKKPFELEEMLQLVEELLGKSLRHDEQT